MLSIIRDFLAPAIVGANPLNILGLHEIMDTRVQRAPTAKTALDEAAYDIAGKNLGIPVPTLLGGALRDRIPVVPSSIELGTPEAAAEEAGLSPKVPQA